MTGELAGMGWYGMVMTLPCGDWESVSSMTRQICLTILGDRLRHASNGDGPLGGVGQHIPRHLDLGPGTLADLFDLTPAFPNQGAALRPAPPASG